ncbi:MAG: DbpA RNA binding domain-containing protein, partial [Flavobacteriaceae bacterium]|nr:DbpA RNA binding domain-containing protein [Flavobacteriaceae bacterium]
IEKIIKTKFEEKPIPSGIEICEIQLFHLANKIKDVEIDHEIDTYLPAIEEVLKDIPKEELIKKMISVEFNRFLSYYKNSRDLTAISSGNNKGEILTEGSVRYFINIGTRDNFDWMSLKDFLRDTLEVGRDDIFKVDVKEGFSFFNTDAELAEKVMSTFEEIRIEGRKINVEISKNDGSRNSGRRDHGERSGGKRDGGRDGGRRNETSGKRNEGGDRRRNDRSDRNERGGDRRRDSKPSGEKSGRRSSSDSSKGFFEKAKRSRRS